MIARQHSAEMRRRGPLLIGLALATAALLARLYRLDAQSLWLDEGSSWAMSREGWGALLAELLNPTAAYPLYHLLLKLWTGIAGDAEWALRLPSAVAGALAVAAVYGAGVELDREMRESLRREKREGAKARAHERERGGGGAAGTEGAGELSWLGVVAALIVLLAPYAIWYGQEAKVYSMLLLSAALIVWALLRALRRRGARDWATLAALCLVAVFVHRLAALLVVAVGWACLGVGGWGARQGVRGRWPGVGGWGMVAAAGLALASGGLVAAMALGLGSESSSTGAYIPAGPASALWLTLVRFCVDRWPGDAPLWWPAPWLLLLAWGLARAGFDLRDARRRTGAAALLILLGAPLALFLGQLVFTRVYEARYLIMIFPAWALLLAYPLRGPGVGGRRSEVGGWGSGKALSYGLCLAGALATGGLALFQAPHGLFSGAPVKEQYREAIRELAARVHPDDAVVVHPGYIRPLYDYYMGRLRADPAPEPISFGNFWRGETSFGQREWDIERRAKLAGYTRSFLLVAPDHARTVDVPLPGDEYGLVGNFWAYSREQRGWPCGIWRYNGAHLLCQEAPEAYYTGEAPQPATAATAVFGANLRLLGFTLKATTAGGPGVYRAGGTLPISLFWDVATQPDEDYSLFLHLCQRCDAPPAASEDGPPLEGYLPTSSWLPGRPARDDRSIALPADMPPGRYTLLLGLYHPDDSSEEGRLAVVGGETVGDDRLILGTVEVVAGEP